MNGDWFWWHLDRPGSYVALWRQMYDYFTKTKGLNNLLWVFSPYGTGKSGLDYYPGDHYCDVTGLDLYARTLASGDYAQLVAKGKPFALTEWAPSMGNYDGAFNLENMLADLKRNMPATGWVLFWSGWKGARMSLVEQTFVSVYLNDPWVITRDEVNWRSALLPQPGPSQTP
jgi:mannan endo-1,4-beta-mannosidase